MDTDRAARAAYWEIVRSLIPYEEVRLALVKIEGDFCKAADVNPTRAGKILADALAEVEWDWPAWHNYAALEDWYSLPTIASDPDLPPKKIASLKKQCREQMATRIAARISRIVYAQNRYEQLTEPGYLRTHPYWRFKIQESGSCAENIPERCAKFDGVFLKANDALEQFPRLPCDYLGCSCSIFSASQAEFERSTSPDNPR